MRIYNNSGNVARQQWEHDILAQLNSQKLSFQLPKPLPVLADPKLTFTPLSNGADACMFELIPGTLPKLTCVEDIGRASGELLSAIQQVKLSQTCPTPPYHDLYAVHHAIDHDSFFREMAGPAFDAIRPAADKAVAYIKVGGRAGGLGGGIWMPIGGKTKHLMYRNLYQSHTHLSHTTPPNRTWRPRSKSFGP
jgi:homoserine kinase type II